MEDQMDPRSVSWIKRVGDLIAEGQTTLGIELGSTRIKACMVLPDGTPAATGACNWENSLVDGHWSYSLDEVWEGLQSCYRDLVENTERQFGVAPKTFKSMGISAMMHGYLAFDENDELLVPFRTWRDTYTGEAATKLTETFGVNIPQRWSIAHYYQAILDGEQHVPQVSFLTTLAGYVQWQLTGEKVLGIGDAVGMFPIDAATRDYDNAKLEAFDDLVAEQFPGHELRALLPSVLVAGQSAGALSAEGARKLDPTGKLRAHVPLCPPEGDAGTGMMATNAVRPRTGNVSVGTSIFAMIVLENALENVHYEIDPVTTPEGYPVAMVHCNNGAQELSTWIELFSEVAVAFGKFKITNMDDVYAAILTEALHGDYDAGGVLAYNYLSGEPISGLPEGRPLLVRSSDAHLSLANFMRAQIYSVFSTLAVGMQILADDGVEVDTLYAHGGVFRTAGVAQRFLAAALDTSVALAESASEGGPWGIALLALYLDHADQSLGDFLDHKIFAGSTPQVIEPKERDVEGFRIYLEQFKRGLPLEHTAITAVPNRS